MAPVREAWEERGRQVGKRPLCEVACASGQEGFEGGRNVGAAGSQQPGQPPEEECAHQQEEVGHGRQPCLRRRLPRGGEQPAQRGIEGEGGRQPGEAVAVRRLDSARGEAEGAGALQGRGEPFEALADAPVAARDERLRARQGRGAEDLRQPPPRLRRIGEGTGEPRQRVVQPVIAARQSAEDRRAHPLPGAQDEREQAGERLVRVGVERGLPLLDGHHPLVEAAVRGGLSQPP
jgi:hypothetical protein